MSDTLYTQATALVIAISALRDIAEGADDHTRAAQALEIINTLLLPLTEEK